MTPDAVPLRPSPLRVLRLRAGFRRQEDLASYIGVSRRTVSRWELGHCQPPPTLHLFLELIIDRHPN